MPNDCVSGTAAPSLNLAGDATLPNQPPRLAHGVAVSAARTVGRSPTARSHGQKAAARPKIRANLPQPDHRNAPPAHRSAGWGERPAGLCAASSLAAAAPLRKPLSLTGRGTPARAPGHRAATERPPRTPQAQPWRPNIAPGVPNARPRNPRAAEPSASPPQPGLADGRLSLLVLPPPEQARALQMLKNHGRRRSESPNHNLDLPQPGRPAAPAPAAALLRIA